VVWQHLLVQRKYELVRRTAASRDGLTFTKLCTVRAAGVASATGELLCSDRAVTR